MNDTNTALIIVFGTLSSLCLCCIITVKCKVSKKVSNGAEKIRKRFSSVRLEQINIEPIFDEETKYGDIESNLEATEEIKTDESRPSQQV
jgi:hypothetical protein